jgi:hypothetical protein
VSSVVVSFSSKILKDHGPKFSLKLNKLQFQKTSIQDPAKLFFLTLGYPKPGGVEDLDQFAAQIASDLTQRLIQAKADETAEAEAAMVDEILDTKSLFGAGADLPLRETKIYRNIHGDKSIVVCRGQKLTLSCEAVKSSLSSLFKKTNFAHSFIVDHTEIATIEYSVRSPFISSRDGMLYVNEWAPPPWTSDETLKPKTIEVIPASFNLYDEFMKKLCLTGEDRNTIESFMRDCLYHKAQTALVMISTPGTGKTTLAQIIGGLVGRDNWMLTTQKMGDTRFDSGLFKKAYLFLDEVPITEGVVEKIKAYLNDYVAAEQKFVNLEKNIRSFVSIMSAINHVKKVHFTFKDRRFNTPQLRRDEITIRDMDEKQIITLKDWSDENSQSYNPQFLNSVADYLLRNYVEGSSRRVVRNAEFNRVCLNKYKRYRHERFLKACHLGEEFNSKTFNMKGEAARSANMTIDEVSDFITDFFADSNKNLGQVFANAAGGWTFKPAKDLNLGFRPEELNSIGSLPVAETPSEVLT